MTVIFILTFLFVFYTYLGYPLLLLLQRRRSVIFPFPSSVRLPRLSLLIPVFNEEAVIEKKIDNSLQLDYPREKLQIVVVSDGSRDRTGEIVSRNCFRGIEFISNPDHRGKMSVLNQVVPGLTGEVVVFTDASAIFSKDALQYLVAPFSEPGIGAVSGALILKEEKTAGGPIKVNWYWRMEKFIRKKESEIDSSLGVTGAIYALRRDLFRKFPEDTILDDLVIPLEVIRRGFRVVFEDRARAYEEKWTDLKLEFRRKVRTLAGNYQVITRSLRTLLPGRPDIALNLIFHKFFRLFVPFALIMLLISSLIGPLFLRPVFFLQIAFYLLAAIGLVGVRPEKKMPAFLSLPLTFCLLNAAAFWAFVNYFLLRRLPTWK